MNEQRETNKDSRALILKVALDLFNKRGYDGTSIDDIRQAAGFKSKASLYSHFKSKDEVAQALLQRILDDEARTVAAAYDPYETDPLHQLGRLGRAFIEWGLTHPDDYAFCYLRIQQETVIGGQRTYLSGEMADPTNEFMRVLVAQMRQNYPVRAIADEAIVSMVVGLINKAVIDRAAFGALSLDHTIAQIMEMCAGLIFSEPTSFPE